MLTDDERFFLYVFKQYNVPQNNLSETIIVRPDRWTLNGRILDNKEFDSMLEHLKSEKYIERPNPSADSRRDDYCYFYVNLTHKGLNYEAFDPRPIQTVSNQNTQINQIINSNVSFTQIININLQQNFQQIQEIIDNTHTVDKEQLQELLNLLKDIAAGKKEPKRGILAKFEDLLSRYSPIVEPVMTALLTLLVTHL